MSSSHRLDQDVQVTVNKNKRIVQRSAILKHSSLLNALVVTGDPGCGKSTFMLDLCDRKGDYELILVNQITGIAEFRRRLQEVLPSTFLLIDGIEDLDFTPKELAEFVINLVSTGARFALSARGYLWRKISYLLETDDITVCKILPLSHNQVLQHLQASEFDIGKTLNVEFFRNPFYLSLLTESESRLAFTDVCQFMDSVIENQVSSVCLKYEIEMLTLLSFLESLAIKMRDNGVKAIHYDIVWLLLERYSLVEDYLGNIGFLQKVGHLYKFTHELFLDFLVAKVIYKSLFLDMDLSSYASFQTSYQEDKFISTFVGASQSLMQRLTKSLAGISEPVLKVNVLGMLAKIDGYDTEYIWHELMINYSVYALYRRAVFNRINTTLRVKPSKIDLEREIATGDDPIAVRICQREREYEVCM